MSLLQKSDLYSPFKPNQVLLFVMACLLFSGVLAYARSSPNQIVSNVEPFTIESSNSIPGVLSVSLDNEVYQLLKDGARSQVIVLPISNSEELSLELERFEVVAPGARFLIGSTAGSITTPKPEVILYRGKVAGDYNSHAYLSFTSRGHSSGYVTVNDETYYIARQPGQEFSTITKTEGDAELSPFVDFCGVGDGISTELKSTRESRGPADSPAGPRVAIIALDADQKYYNIFGDIGEAENYLLQLLGAVSDIYLRDVNMKLMTTFVRIWSAGGEPFDQNSLGSFRDYWNNNEDTSGLDIVHLITGRRDLSFGGIAYVHAFCSDIRYSISGFMNGSFPVPFGAASISNWDVIVMAHELGHNFGTYHTHDISQYDPLIDSCAFDFPSLGTIMSYCHIHPGYTSNIEVRFPVRVQQIIETAVVFGSDCFWFDCNDNGIDDAIDIAGPTSDDVNLNNIPDECEDCNGNSILDNIDILGASDDENGNGIPDECEADCDGNGTPDEYEAYFLNDVDDDGILDVCEPDCNGNDTADFLDIALGTLTDYDRNNIPDVCQDCNSNSISDWIDLEREYNLYVADRNGGIREYHAKSGVPIQTFESSIAFHDVAIGADRSLYAIANESDVVKINPNTGASSIFWPAPAVGSRALTFGPDGNLYVVNFNQDLVRKINGTTGADMGVFVTAGLGGLDGPSALKFGSNGNLFVASELTNSVIEYSGVNGALVGVFVTSDDGGLNTPRGLTFNSDGNLLVTSFMTSQVLEYDGINGAFIGQFNDENAPENPWGITVGPNGHVYTVRTQDQLYQVFENFSDVGRYYRSFIRRDYGLVSPAGLAFMPISQFDCNANYILDGCEGPSSPCCCIGIRGDANGDGINANILDLSFVVNFIFRGSANPGPCQAESDVNGDGSLTPNILDLNYLVNRIFRGGPLPGVCAK